MTFLTIFTAPKPFTDPHINIIQRNAIASWLQLGQDVAVILIGDEAGLAETASEIRVPHLPMVIRNEWGTPLVSSIFDLARTTSNTPLLCYINADILVMPDFLEAARQVARQAQEFLLVGQRWDLEVNQPLIFSEGWEIRLRSAVQTRGVLHPPSGSDFFLFPRKLFTEIPPFAIGRAGWDNWMIYHAREQGWATIDISSEVMVIHQDHDYSHLPDGKPHYDQEESLHNMALARNTNPRYASFTLLETNRELRGGRIRLTRPSLLRILHRLEIAWMPDRHQGPRWKIVRIIRKWRRSLMEKDFA